ncbi:MAG: Fe-S protein assembly co-chaperone HscB [Betaproteobacteria bacterium]|nr:Fe-S protein assembly co-chaperone HscB [Betaproteobacteria bacterium]
MTDHFALFGLQPSFSIDAEALERSYREIQEQVHPDRHASGGDAERRASMQWTMRVNEAYRALKSPLERAKYLLELNGVDVAFETNTAMPTDFLMRQMELRESLEEAAAGKNPAALDALRGGLRGDARAIEAELAERIDRRRDYQGASGLVRKLKFLQRLDEEIDAVFDEIEA